MDEMEQQARTVAVKACAECAAGLLERDKYCRWCGVRQARNEEQSFATTAIAGSTRGDVYRKISGPLVCAVVSGALSAPSAENQSAFVKRVILALISIPIWLIIVLLSPLDAYAAVRNLARQV